MEKVKLESIKLIGISIRTTNENQQAAKDIPCLWMDFMKNDVLNKIPNKSDNTIYAVYTDYESDYTQAYTTVIGCKVTTLDNIPEGMVAYTFDGGNYLKTTVRGDLEKDLVINQWIKIWEMDAKLNRAYTADFEVYGDKAQNYSDVEVDILVAVK